MNENQLLESLRDLFAAADPSVLVGSGPDDCAHLELDGRRLAASTDAFVEGSHFLADTPARDVAVKALAASLSDLAASGCRARWALVSLGLRAGLAPDWAGEFSLAMAETARKYGVSVVGGDIVSSRGGVFVSVTVLGEPLAGGPVLRSGARPGDCLVVTGELGGSLRGRHLGPVPRLAEMRLLMEYCRGLGDSAARPDAAMDISDGLSLDLARLCRESGTGAVIEAAAVPISLAAREAAAESGRTPLAHALSDGEDFELLLALPPRIWEGFREFLAGAAGRRAAAGLAAFTEVGAVTGGRELFLRRDDGVLSPLAPEGYEHRW